jgi:hypothetical protein
MAGKDQVSIILSPDQDRDKLMAIQPSIAQINLRTLTSTCHSNLNKHALDWSHNGLLAFGSYGVIVIVDPKNLKPITVGS